MWMNDMNDDIGWLRERDSSEILHYIAQVQQMIWDHRYKSE